MESANEDATSTWRCDMSQVVVRSQFVEIDCFSNVSFLSDTKNSSLNQLSQVFFLSQAMRTNLQQKQKQRAGNLIEGLQGIGPSWTILHNTKITEKTS